MKKKQVISEVLTAVRKALDAKLTHETYSEYIKGSVSFRLDLISKPEKVVSYLDLPSRKPLEIRFTRPYTRRRAFPVEVSDAVEK